jgi:hypothetical protein
MHDEEPFTFYRDGFGGEGRFYQWSKRVSVRTCVVVCAASLAASLTGWTGALIRAVIGNNGNQGSAPLAMTIYVETPGPVGATYLVTPERPARTGSATHQGA